MELRGLHRHQGNGREAAFQNRSMNIMGRSLGWNRDGSNSAPQLSSTAELLIQTGFTEGVNGKRADTASRGTNWDSIRLGLRSSALEQPQRSKEISQKRSPCSHSQAQQTRWEGELYVGRGYVVGLHRPAADATFVVKPRTK
jgi:hypothetical protein